MKAAVLRGLRDIVIRNDAPIPTIGPKDVLVRSRACGICGTDVHIFDGEFFPTYPLIQGHEMAGEVVEVGKEVTELAAGDRVMVDPTVTCEECHFCMTQRQNHCLKWNAVGVTRDGGFAEYVRVPAKNCYRFDRVGFAEGAFTEPLACVVFGQDRARIGIGSDVLIFGAGPIGQLQLQASRANGAASVTVVDTMESKLDLATKFGAANVVIADTAMDEKLRKISKWGFDVVIDATGNPKAVQAAIPHIANGGRFLIFGVCSPDATIEIKPFEIYRRDIEIIGSFAIRRTYDRAFRLMENGVIRVKELISESLPIEELAAGIERMKTGKAAMKLQVVFA